MSSVNKVFLIGNLGRKPELRDVGGNQLATFSLATSRIWNDKAGQRQEATTWHRIVVWGKQAQQCAEYLDKGSQACVEGSLEIREYTAQDGTQQKVTEIRAREVTFLGGKRAQTGAQPHDEQMRQAPQKNWRPQQQQQAAQWGQRDEPPAMPMQDEDIPF